MQVQCSQTEKNSRPGFRTGQNETNRKGEEGEGRNRIEIHEYMDYHASNIFIMSVR